MAWFNDETSEHYKKNPLHQIQDEGNLQSPSTGIIQLLYLMNHTFQNT